MRPGLTPRLGGHGSSQPAYLPREQAERQRQAFPSAQVELLDGHDHGVMLKDPGRVASLVIPVLSRQLPGSISAKVHGIVPSVKGSRR